MLVPLFAAIAPFLVWPIELLLPYPYVIEELAKLLLVIFILNENVNSTIKIRLAILAGLFFALSESALYMFNIQLVGTLSTLLQRLALTLPLHGITTLIILFSGIKSRAFLIIGITIAMILHYTFNLFVGGL